MRPAGIEPATFRSGKGAGGVRRPSPRASVRGRAGLSAGQDRVLRRIGRGRDRARLWLHGFAAGTGVAVVEGGGVAWPPGLLGAVELRTTRPARSRGHFTAPQNVPVKLSDPLALAKVAEILAQGKKRGVRRDSSKRLSTPPRGADETESTTVATIACRWLRSSESHSASQARRRFRCSESISRRARNLGRVACGRC